MIEKFGVILNSLVCGFAAQLFEKLYPWYYIPAPVHYVLNLLIHGSDIITSKDLPVGLYSEEALEARSKNIRSF